MQIAAKLQLGNTWELSAVPYMPVEKLVAQHMVEPAREGVDGLMLGWTLGGYPSPNLEIAATIHSAAGEAVGGRSACCALRPALWARRPRPMSSAPGSNSATRSSSFPLTSESCIPLRSSSGPQTLLYQEPTGYRATMVGFPYDDLRALGRDLSARCVPAPMAGRSADGWADGLATLAQARPLRRPPRSKPSGVSRRPRTCTSAASPTRSSSCWCAGRTQRATRELLADEEALARRLFDIADADSRIGFEATNHYFYTPLDLVEKVLNCRDSGGHL